MATSSFVELRAHRHAATVVRAPSSLPERLRRAIRGEVRFDTASRALYARDASNFRMTPLGVVVPKDAEDVAATLAICRDQGAPILSRGGGTSLAGQCCNEAVVLDFSKYMNRVLEIDPQRRLARVLPGTVLDELRRAAGVHGLTFGPDPATHDHCTIGGMLGNNSCGVHAVMAEFYGPGPRMEDNVRELEVLTYDGLRLRVGPTSEAELEAIIRAGGRRGQIYGDLRSLRDRFAGLIRARYPHIPRRVSGYNLTSLLPEHGFNLAHALVGSESTCVTVLEASLELLPAMPHRSLLVLGYPSVVEAGRAIVRVRALEAKPIACEGLDHLLIEDVTKKGLHANVLPLLPAGRGWLIVQFGSAEPGAASEQAERALERLRDGTVDHRLYSEGDQSEGIWQLRESGLGATAFVPGQPDTWPGWEDAAVPPEHVGEYLNDFRELLARYGYHAALYGHFAQGCVHTRIPFDLESEHGLAQYRSFTREAAEMVVRHGGSLSGEHGDGQQRGELLPVMFGAELVSVFREFKRIWDPDGKMNPGKVVDALPRTANLTLGANYHPWQPETHFPFADDKGKMSHAALRCVGVGKCRRREGGIMCPSFMVLHEEEHTTRGRAHLLHEMFQGDVVTDGWQSSEVKQALDLCLSCKGCTHDCPVNVDIPTMKAEFLSHYHEAKGWPRQALTLGLVQRWARLGAALPELANFVTQTPGVRQLAKWAAGIHPERDIPRFARRTFRSWFRQHAPRAGGGRRVLLWPDTFNNYFYPGTLAAALEVLTDAGCQVVIPKRVLCCGRPLYDYGLLDTAKRYWERILGDLAGEIAAGTPVVGVEPSCVAAFRDELVNLFPERAAARELAKHTHTLAEFLSQHVPGYQPPRLPRQRAIVHYHCHQRAIVGSSCDDRLLAAVGLELEQPQETCCGMAGSFGFERDHYELSNAIGELKLLPAVRRATSATLIVADGFSCRTQVQAGAKRRPLHLAEVLQLARRHAGQRLAAEDPPARLVPVTLEPRLSRGAQVLIAGLLAAGTIAVARAARRLLRR
jgi:FAD/FMN-containing dehydrogenase/Fe-S oxidoreductase